MNILLRNGKPRIVRRGCSGGEKNNYIMRKNSTTIVDDESRDPQLLWYPKKSHF